MYVCMYTQDLQSIDFSAWNSYADPNFVYYDRELLNKCQSADPVSLAALMYNCMFFLGYQVIEYMHVPPECQLSVCFLG